ncbi:MAG: hypothetical protein EOM59_02660 [Clostridia bacterium]|nr:hypothetical protein [Clostridia bacterium]
MRKKVLILLSVIVMLIIAIALMFIFKICPPEGPWPMPPWCVEKTPFEYQELDYIPDNFTLANPDKKLDLGIGTFDVWGNMHLFLDLGEDTRDHYEYTIQRIGTIQSDLYLITDVITLGEGGTLITTDDVNSAGLITISEDYLTQIGTLLKKNNIQKFMYLINLNDNTDEIEGYLSTDLTASERLIAEEFKQKTIESVGYASGKILDDYTQSDWDAMFDRWEEVLVERAKICEAAGVVNTSSHFHKNNGLKFLN